MREWLHLAQVNQQENDVATKPEQSSSSRYQPRSNTTSKQEGESGVHFTTTNSGISEEDTNSEAYNDDEEEEDFVYDRNPHESFGNISQQFEGANLVFAHMMPSFESSEYFGNPSQT